MGGLSCCFFVRCRVSLSFLSLENYVFCQNLSWVFEQKRLTTVDYYLKWLLVKNVNLPSGRQTEAAYPWSTVEAVVCWWRCVVKFPFGADLSVKLLNRSTSSCLQEHDADIWDIYKFTHLQSHSRLVFSVSVSLNTVVFFYQVTLESCQIVTPANLELVEPHLDRMQKLIKAWKTEVSLNCFCFTTK